MSDTRSIKVRHFSQFICASFFSVYHLSYPFWIIFTCQGSSDWWILVGRLKIPRAYHTPEVLLQIWHFHNPLTSDTDYTNHIWNKAHRCTRSWQTLQAPDTAYLILACHYIKYYIYISILPNFTNIGFPLPAIVPEIRLKSNSPDITQIQ